MTAEEPDIEIAAALRAEALRIEVKPRVDVSGYGDSHAVADSSSERTNLPDELAEGVTYTDFAVRWRVAAWLEDPRPGGI